jgi:uncharacterized protein (DUF1697 family)
MAWVVFLRGVNVGTANRCRPAQIAIQLKKFDIVNIGAVGTFVVRQNVDESKLRAAIAKKLPFKVEIMIVPAKAIVDLTNKNLFEGYPESGAEITRFVSVLQKRPRKLPSIPLSLPSVDDWVFKIIATPNCFVIGIYRRQMKAISYLGKIEKLFGVPATTRSWSTIEKVAKVLTQS